MEELLFGTGGTPHSAETPSTVSGIIQIKELGLGCMEMEFVQGVRMGEESAHLVAAAATRNGVKLSAHGPYFINLNAHEPAKIKASQDRILQTARVAAWCGAVSITFHAAFYLDDPPEKTYSAVKYHLGEVINQLKKEGNRVQVRPEIMGKPSQFGTLDEVFQLCNELEGIAPCIDFAHWHARTGKYNSYREFVAILQQLEGYLGRTALDDMHIHISGIFYGGRGELKHLNLKDSDFRYTEFLQALKDYDARGIVICESPNLEEDALLLQTTYNTLQKAS